MELTTVDIVRWVNSFMWPFIRFGAMFVAAPFFGARSIPVRIRVILALTLALLVQGTLAPPPSIELMSLGSITLVIQQVLIGILLGGILQASFGAMVLAGQTVATSMGLGFASAVDPQNGVQVTIMGQFYVILATLIFLSLNGHLQLIEMLAYSFEVLPVSGDLLVTAKLWSVVIWVGELFVFGLLICLPVVCGVLMVNLAFGIVTRAAPQLNIFAVGFPVTMLVGFILLLVTVPTLQTTFASLFEQVFLFMRATLAP